MKVRTIDAIRMMNVREVAKIIGAIVLMQTKGLSAEEGLKYEYHATEKALLKEIEINRNQTNAERIRSMEDEKLALFLQHMEARGCYGGISDSVKILEWLRSESEE